ncbi:hypothetical protein [Azospirillum sp. sgz302134]
MTKLAALAAALALAAAPAALAQSQGQLETQKGPQDKPMQRATPQDTAGPGRSYGQGEKGVGEQSGQPPGNRLARPADPSKPTRGDAMQPNTKRSDTTATNAKPGETLTDKGRKRPETAERPPSAGQPTLDRSHDTDPGGRTPIKRADDAKNNPPPDPNK